jgi:hypothetical protein
LRAIEEEISALDLEHKSIRGQIVGDNPFVE